MTLTRILCIDRSHLKGVVGRVNVESQDVDKNQKKKQQEEYRRQLEIQARADQDRREMAEKNQWGDVSNMAPKNREKEKHPSLERNGNSQHHAPPLENPDDPY